MALFRDDEFPIKLNSPNFVETIYLDGSISACDPQNKVRFGE